LIARRVGAVALVVVLVLVLASAGCGGSGSHEPSRQAKLWLLSYQELLNHWRSEFHASEANRHGGAIGDAKRYLRRTFPFAPSDARFRLRKIPGDVPDGERAYAQITGTAVAGKRMARGFLHGARGARYHALRRAFTRSLDASYRAIGATSDLRPAELR
jgi:hypothetical protein